VTVVSARRRFWFVLVAVLSFYLAGLLTGVLASLVAWQFGLYLLVGAVVLVYLHHLRARWLRLLAAVREEIRDESARTVPR